MNTQLFSGRAEDYFAARPSYPAAAAEWLSCRVPAGRAADIGAGTGIFTRTLLKKFPSVIAVEPNADMRKIFLQNLPSVPCLDTCAEATGIEKSSVALVTCAQAFHWFDEEKFKAECQRILVSGGKIAIIWNNPVKDDFTSERDGVYKKLCPRFSRGYAGKRSAEEGDVFLREVYLKNVEIVVFDNPFVMNEETFIANMSSRSYAPERSSGVYVEFTEKLHKVFHRHAVNGKVVEKLQTQIYLGNI